MHIVLALDGSKESKTAVSLLAELPWRERPVVTLVSALVDTPYDLIATDQGLALGEAERENAEKGFEDAKAKLATVCQSVETVLRREHPRDLIMRTAERQNADLIVLGARGHSAAYRLFAGSTSEFVANRAPCSVLVVRGEVEEGEKVGISRILLAWDGSRPSQIAFDQLLAMNWPASTHVCLTTQLERPKMLPEDVVYDPEHVAACNEQLVQQAAKLPPSLESSQRVEEVSHIGSALSGMAGKDQVDLLYVGASGKSAVQRFFLGSTSLYLLHHAPCSLWIARTKAW